MCPPDLEITLVNVAFRVACVQCAEGAATLALSPRLGQKPERVAGACMASSGASNVDSWVLNVHLQFSVVAAIFGGEV